MGERTVRDIAEEAGAEALPKLQDAANLILRFERAVTAHVLAANASLAERYKLAKAVNELRVEILDAIASPLLDASTRGNGP